MSSTITTQRTVDPPVQLTADYQLDATDRRYLDDQIRGTQQHLVESLINGQIASWWELSGSSDPLLAGDVFCAYGDPTGRIVTKATATPLGAAGRALGIALIPAAAGASVRGIVLGTVEAAVTGLAAGAAGAVRVNTTTARPERLAGGFTPGDYPLGFVDASGTLSLGVENPVGTTSDHGSLTGLMDDDHPQYTLANGTRAFTGVVDGITPTAAVHLATKGYVDSLIQGLEWRDSVLERRSSPPGAPGSGDRYLVIATATGAWTGHEDEIATWNGSSWDFEVPSDGWAVWVEDVDKLYVYNGTAWVLFGSTVDHGNLQGLGDDDHMQYVLVTGTRAMTGDLQFASGSSVKTLAGDLTLDVAGGELMVDLGLAAIRAQFSATNGRGLEVYKPGDLTELVALDYQRLQFDTDAAVDVGYSTAHTSAGGSILRFSGQNAFVGSGLTGGPIQHRTGDGDGVADGDYEVYHGKSDLKTKVTAVGFQVYNKGTPAEFGKFDFAEVLLYSTGGQSHYGVFEKLAGAGDQTLFDGQRGAAGFAAGASIFAGGSSNTASAAGNAILAGGWNYGAGAKGSASMGYGAPGATTNVIEVDSAGNIGYNAATPGPKPTVTGTRNANPALADLLAEMDTLGFLTDSTTAGTAPLLNVVEDTTPQLGGLLDCQNYSLDDVQTVTHDSCHDYGNLSSGTEDIEWDLYQYAKINVTASATINLDNPRGVGEFCLLVTSASSPGTTITWTVDSGTLTWIAGTAPTFPGGGTRKMSFCFDGSNWLAEYTLQY
jgi:hypothetical protein